MTGFILFAVLSEFRPIARIKTRPFKSSVDLIDQSKLGKSTGKECSIEACYAFSLVYLASTSSTLARTLAAICLLHANR